MQESVIVSGGKWESGEILRVSRLGITPRFVLLAQFMVHSNLSLSLKLSASVIFLPLSNCFFYKFSSLHY